MTIRRQWLATAALVLAAALVDSRQAVAQAQDLTSLSLEDLMNVEITSASRKPQALSRTAAAVYVITQEDIRRSGSKTIPDLLRMVPGVSVGQIDSSSWAVSARGFTGLYSNKLLVMIDGRSVYSSIFGGVHWDMLGVPLGDIDRIEVIRGPGGTLWGANAVNGVVNIITKTADATPGGQVSARLGTPDQRAGDVRYGGRLNPQTSYRVFAGYAGGGMDAPFAGFIDPDDASVRLGGARMDWHRDIDAVAVEGAVQQGDADHIRKVATFAPPFSTLRRDPSSFTDGHVTASWTRSASSRSETAVQADYQQHGRTELGVRERTYFVNVDARQRRTIGGRQDLVAGLGYRSGSATVTEAPGLRFVPAEERQQLFSGFLQDEVEIRRTFVITPGIKFERNSYTGGEFQPSLRTVWMPFRQNTVWAAVTRAVRTPTRLERGLQGITQISAGPGGLPAVVQIQGNPAFHSEDVRALEVGYRWQRRTTSVDVTAFRNAYVGLSGAQAGLPARQTIEGRPALVVPVQFANLLNASARGLEVLAHWQPTVWWKVAGSYALLHVNSRLSDGSASPLVTEGPVPGRQFHVRSYVELPRNIEVSALLYVVSAIEAPQLQSYRKLDLRLAWRASRAIELAVAAQNLLHGRDHEFQDSNTLLSLPLRTSAFAELLWHF